MEKINTFGESNNRPVDRWSIIAEFPLLRLAITGTPRAIAYIKHGIISMNNHVMKEIDVVGTIRLYSSEYDDHKVLKKARI